MIPDRERTTGSLFERMEASPARNWQGSSIHALRQSIRQNLRNILNTRSGSCRVRLNWALMNRKGLKTSANQ